MAEVPTVKSAQAYQKIRDLILSGSKLPGTHLVLSDLEQELGIGRGPIREALMRLDRSGLVRSTPYKGMVVAPLPTLREIEQIYALRVQLELFLTLEAMEHLMEEQFSELEDILKRMQNFSAADFVRLDREFHTIIYREARLPHLNLLAEKIFEPVEAFLSVYSPDRQTCVDSLDEHYVLLEALRLKDAAKASKALTSNIKRGIQTIQQGYAMSRYGGM